MRPRSLAVRARAGVGDQQAASTHSSKAIPLSGSVIRTAASVTVLSSLSCLPSFFGVLFFGLFTLARGEPQLVEGL